MLLLTLNSWVCVHSRSDTFYDLSQGPCNGNLSWECYSYSLTIPNVNTLKTDNLPSLQKKLSSVTLGPCCKITCYGILNTLWRLFTSPQFYLTKNASQKRYLIDWVAAVLTNFCFFSSLCYREHGVYVWLYVRVYYHLSPQRGIKTQRPVGYFHLLYRSSYHHHGKKGTRSKKWETLQYMGMHNNTVIASKSGFLRKRIFCAYCYLHAYCHMCLLSIDYLHL